MAREKSVDASAVVERELTRLGSQNMPLTDFLVQANLSEDEKEAFKALRSKRNDHLYIDAVNFATPTAMVGKFGGE